MRDDDEPTSTAADAAAEQSAATSDAIAGSRFVSRFEERAHLHRLHPHRLWRILVGLGLLAFGIVNIFIPGPGGSVIVLAALLVLAGESRTLARLLDHLEVRFAHQVAWALRHKLTAAILVSAAALLVVTLGGYAVTRLR